LLKKADNVGLRNEDDSGDPVLQQTSPHVPSTRRDIRRAGFHRDMTMDMQRDD